MKYDFNGKVLRIPDDELENTMKHLGVSKEEAIEIWLEDEGYLDNEEQEQLCKVAKENRITATIHKASGVDKQKDEIKRKTQKERTQREDLVKEMIIAEIAQFLPKIAENIEVLNKGKLITFQIGEEKFKLDLTKTRIKKN